MEPKDYFVVEYFPKEGGPIVAYSGYERKEADNIVESSNGVVNLRIYSICEGLGKKIMQSTYEYVDGKRWVNGKIKEPNPLDLPNSAKLLYQEDIKAIKDLSDLLQE